MSDLVLTKDDTTTTPPSGTVSIYPKTDGLFYTKTDAGVETTLKGDTGLQGATGEGVPAGGTAGQFLKKDSATNYDTSWSVLPGPTVTGTIAVPQGITAGGGVSPSDVNEEVRHVAGSGGPVTVTATPPVAAGSIDGQILELVGASDTNTLTLSQGSALMINGNVTLGLWASITLRWVSASSLWREVCRNDISSV